MPDPLTPLGRDVFRQGAVTVSNFINLSTTLRTQRFFFVAAKRLFIKVTGAVRHSHARHLIRRALKMVEPSTGQALELLLADPRLAPEKGHIRRPRWCASFP